MAEFTTLPSRMHLPNGVSHSNHFLELLRQLVEVLSPTTISTDRLSLVAQPTGCHACLYGWKVCSFSLNALSLLRRWADPVVSQSRALLKRVDLTPTPLLRSQRQKVAEGRQTSRRREPSDMDHDCIAFHVVALAASIPEGVPMEWQGRELASGPLTDRTR